MAKGEEEGGSNGEREDSEWMNIQVFEHLNTTQQPETSVGELVGCRVTEREGERERLGDQQIDN